MRKKWIGMLLSFLLLSGSITPSVYAVTIYDRTNTSQQSTSNINETTATSSNVPLTESSNPSTDGTLVTTENTGENLSKGIPVDEAHFPDQNFRQFLIEMMEEKHSNVLSDELLATTELDLSGRNIKSLDGIYYFEQLKKLEVQNNDLEQVDVSALSELTYLDISKNKLPEIDLSMNDKLTYFNGTEQIIDANASKIDNEWQISKGYLNPELDRMTIHSTNWKYDGSVFSTLEPSELNYSYQVKFSQNAILEEASDHLLNVTVEVNFQKQNSVESIVPKEEKIEMIQGETKILEYSIVPQNAEIKQPVWISSNDQIVHVDQNGTVTAVEPGEVTISLLDEEEELGTFKINVNKTTEESTIETTESTQIDEKEDIQNSFARVSNSPTVSYQTHVKNIGWQTNQTNGSIAGTTGRNLWMEAIRITTSGTGVSGDIEYSSHVKNIGWQNYVKNGETSGTTGRVLQMEAIRIRLTGELAQNYDIYYRAHVANFGWLGWAKNGEDAGTAGYVYQMEGIQIQLVRKNQGNIVTGNAFFQKNMNNPTISYQTFVRDQGWQGIRSNGETSGTTNQNRWIEAMRMQVTNTNLTGNIEYSSHIKNIGWMNFVSNNNISGTTDRYAQSEAIRIRLTGQLNQFYNVYYRVHAANFGWLGWAKNGADAGSSGFVYQLEAIEVRLVPKGQPSPGGGVAFYNRNTLADPTINYQAHLRNVGWQAVKRNGATAGTTGQSSRVEAMRINVSNTPIPGAIEYSTHVQNIGWQGYVRNNDLAGTTGRALHVEAVRIRLTGQLNQFYDVYYRVHSANFGWLDWAKNNQYAGTANLNFPMEAIQVVLVRKGAAAPGPTTTPYQTSINHLFVMGHGAGDPGATHNGINERDFTRNELMPYLQKWTSRLKRNRITYYDTNADMFQDSRRLQGAYTISNSFSSVTEFHLDAGAIGISTGGHVIAHRNGNSLTTQNYAIANVIRTNVGLWGSVQNTGGINLRSDLLNMNVLHSRGIPYRLAELGFITNTRDVENIRRNMDQIAKGIVEGVTGERL
ncbi:MULTISPECIES: N-acetylmuramoyl-L-alanine amidase [unclassified Enterococcus]|uniref:N-acetylmuramoyl-L-alanine amidase n=1 Tax=unclassified Enterococcus TaxID=2608891 RepID=UPI001A9B458C|nr:N-acetylmuramoyl-L-alanine amidase [Enterococcus sp. DIV1271a]MBO1300381.1 N-acetylmuramoyl-L-alanine amidase [Enterococcus sp. DIV1271a]